MSVSPSFLEDFVLQEVEKGSLCESLAKLDRRTSDLVLPRFEGKFSFRKFTGFHRESSLESLAFLSWYLNDTWRPMVQLWLGEQLRFVNSDCRMKVKLLLSHRSIALCYLAEQVSFRSLKGNLVTLWKNVLDNLRLVFKKDREPRRKIRRRGYDDHGSLRPSHKWLPKSDFSFTEEQNALEEDRETDESTVQILEGWFS
jgi:hypothetical protein